MTATKQFLTIYRQDYIPLQTKKPDKPVVDKEPTHTAEEDYEFFNLRHQFPPPPPSAIDLANEYLDQTFKKEHPKLYKIYFKEPLQKSEIEPELRADSAYVKEYCRHMKEPVADTIDIEVLSAESTKTEMKDSYRSPDLYGPIPRSLPVKQESKLTRINQVIAATIKTDCESEYGKRISATGKLIIDNEIHGKITYPSLDK